MDLRFCNKIRGDSAMLCRFHRNRSQETSTPPIHHSSWHKTNSQRLWLQRREGDPLSLPLATLKSNPGSTSCKKLSKKASALCSNPWKALLRTQIPSSRDLASKELCPATRKLPTMRTAWKSQLTCPDSPSSRVETQTLLKRRTSTLSSRLGRG